MLTEADPGSDILARLSVSEARTAEIAIAVLAPKGRDAEVLRAAAGAGGPAMTLDCDADLVRAIHDGRAGAAVLTREALTATLVDALARTLENAPPWKEVPLLVLVDARGNTLQALERLRFALPRMRVLVLQRPLRPSAVTSAFDQMRRIRARQIELRRYVERERALRHELNHRVKNILASVQALYALSRRATSGDAFHAAFEGRLEAVAGVHAALFRGQEGALGMDGAVRAVLEPVEGHERIDLSCDPVPVTAEAAQAFALIVHELATNARRFGALSADEGRVALVVRRDADALVLTWTETGGPPAREPERPGAGTRFVLGTARQLGGEARFRYGEGGLEVAIDVPAASVLREGRAAGREE